MFKTIEGTYQDGEIKLNQLPQNITTPAQVIVMFLDSNQVNSTKLRQLIEHLETIEGIQQGFEELNAGKTRSISDFIQEMHKKYDISD